MTERTRADQFHDEEEAREQSWLSEEAQRAHGKIDEALGVLWDAIESGNAAEAMVQLDEIATTAKAAQA